MSQIEKKMQIEHQYIGTIFGQFDSNIKKNRTGVLCTNCK